MTGEFEKLAYEAALRSLDKQERLLEEMRARTGVLLAASSVAITLLGQKAFRNPGGGLLTAVGSPHLSSRSAAGCSFSCPETG